MVGHAVNSLSGGIAHLAALIANSLADAALAGWSVAQSLEVSAVADCRALSVSSAHLLADKALLVCWCLDHCRKENATMLTCVAAGLVQFCMKASRPIKDLTAGMELLFCCTVQLP